VGFFFFLEKKAFHARDLHAARGFRHDRDDDHFKCAKKMIKRREDRDWTYCRALFKFPQRGIGNNQKPLAPGFFFI